MNVTKLDYFYIDNQSFKGIGREQLKCTNQLNYRMSPGRQTDGSMQNLNDYDTFVVPSVEIGFLYINVDTFLRLRNIMLTKRKFIVRYFDVDFGRYVLHEMYAQPDELKNFLNLGEDVMGLQNFKLTLVGTLNKKDAIMPLEYGVGETDPIDFINVPETFTLTAGNTTIGDIKWGRSVIVPDGTWKLSISGGQELIIDGGDRINIYENTILTAV